MSSNCYLVYDEVTKRCLVIDPASEFSEREIAFMQQKDLIPNYIILTHEHTDHTWGVNAIIEKYPLAKIVCSRDAVKGLTQDSVKYFRLYYDRKDYTYQVCRVDREVMDGSVLEWYNREIRFITTPGHSVGSMCIEIDGMLFTGDTIMPFKPYLNKRDGSMQQYRDSLLKIQSMYSSDTIVYPGHGEQGTLENMIKFVKILHVHRFVYHN